ncbi:MAG TPA: PLDc N-terminal domain-containing protein [Gaiellaceae bacterium]|nr:PLDc N-terminal domain-containing protein [Gaiellaceae bacterium]
MSELVLGIGWLLGGGITVLSVLAVVVGIAAIVSVLRNEDFSRGSKLLWVVVIVLLPLLGGAIYFGVRSDW